MGTYGCYNWKRPEDIDSVLEGAFNLNQILIRIGFPPWPVGFLTQIEMRNEILLERRLELAFEGFKIHDIKRLHQNVASFPYNDPKLVFPIPARELEANSKLKSQQNPGY